MTTRPHDALFKAAFQTPEHAAQLFRGLLPPSIGNAIAWDSTTLESGSFVDRELADRHTDLLFSARCHGDRGGVLLYLLLEHQSSNDPDMPLRLLAYQVRIWERFRNQRAGARLPPIIPCVVSHAPEGWTAPRSFEELLDPHPASIPGLAELVPRFSILIEDLAHLTTDELRARTLAVFPKLALWLLRDARTMSTSSSRVSRSGPRRSRRPLPAEMEATRSRSSCDTSASSSGRCSSTHFVQRFKSLHPRPERPS